MKLSEMIDPRNLRKGDLFVFVNRSCRPQITPIIMGRLICITDLYSQRGDWGILEVTSTSRISFSYRNFYFQDFFAEFIFGVSERYLHSNTLKVLLR